jgi:hypothetical protein
MIQSKTFKILEEKTSDLLSVIFYNFLKEEVEGRGFVLNDALAKHCAVNSAANFISNPHTLKDEISDMIKSYYLGNDDDSLFNNLK